MRNQKNTSKENPAAPAKSDQALLYQLDGRPRLRAAVPIGLQHVFAMFTGNLAPLLIVAGVVGSLSEGDINIMVQCAMLMSGLTTLLQVFPIKIGKFQIGSGLPLVVGTSFAFVPTMNKIGLQYGIGGILGGTLLGAVLEVLMGVFIGPLKKVFTPLVVGPVLITIGLNLMPTGIRYFAGGAGSDDFGSWENLLLGLVVFLIISCVNRFGKGMLKNLGILIGIAVGYLLAVVMGKVDFTPLSQAAWFGLPKFMHIKPSFHPEAIISFAAVYIVVGLETLGNMSGIANSALDRDIEPKEASGGIIANGLASIVGALFGTYPSSAFGQNAGLVSMSKIVNRFAVGSGAVIMIAAAFLPKIGAVFSAMPASVLGGAVISVFAMIFLNGAKMIAKEGFSPKNIQILSITFGLGYGIGIVEEATAQLPAALHFVFGEPVLSVCVVAILASLLYRGFGKAKAAS